MNDDRIKSDDAGKKLPKPEVYIVRSGNAVFKPGMKTWFVETREDAPSAEVSGGVRGATGGVVTSTVCVCNKVCTCEAVCSCVGHCTCNSVCTCQSVCSCQSVGRTCSCNPRVCTCVPVH